MRIYLIALLLACVACKCHDSRGSAPVFDRKGNFVVYYNQADSHWGSKMWSAKKDTSQTYQNSACGPSSMAMIVATLSPKGFDVTPYTLGEWAIKNKLRTDNNGPKPEFFPLVAKEYGLNCRKTENVEEGLNEISNDKGVNVLAVANVKPGTHFAPGTSGHFVMVYDVDDKDNVWVFDPGHRSKHSQPKAEFLKACRYLYLISKKESDDIVRYFWSTKTFTKGEEKRFTRMCVKTKDYLMSDRKAKIIKLYPGQEVYVEEKLKDKSKIFPEGLFPTKSLKECTTPEEPDVPSSKALENIVSFEVPLYDGKDDKSAADEVPATNDVPADDGKDEEPAQVPAQEVPADDGKDEEPAQEVPADDGKDDRL